MCKFGQAAWLMVTTGLWFSPELRAQANTNLVVAFSTTNSTPLNPGFAGFCSATKQCNPNSIAGYE
jgi:hypothetical protein